MKRNGSIYGIVSLGTLLAAMPATAALQVSTLYAGGITWPQIIANIVDTMAGSIFYVSAAAFLLGAMMYILGFVNEENKSKGKGIMIGSLVGIAVALSALAILNTVLYYLYG